MLPVLNFDNPIIKIYYLQKNSSRISFTLDVWTSPNTLAFLGVTAHWIDDSWKLKDTLLDFCQIHGAHSGENICNTFLETLEFFQLSSKVHMQHHL